MGTRTRTLTALGLAARDELLVRSLLKVVNMRTTEAWLFHEEIDADVALCNPDSALSMMTLKKAGSAGQLCIPVVHDVAQEQSAPLVLRAPIRSSDFIEVLNQASAQLQQATSLRRAPSADGNDEPLAHALFRLRLQAAATHVRIGIGGATLIVDLKTRRLGSTHALNDDELLMIGQERMFQLQVIDEVDGGAALQQTRHIQSIDRLWWLSGMHSAAAGAATISADRRYQLRRWPDAGRLPMESFHLRMTAVLTRGAMTALQLAEAVKRPTSDALAYLAGCSMLGLLVEVVEPREAATLAVPVTRASRYSDLFQSLRAVLGIRG